MTEPDQIRCHYCLIVLEHPTRDHVVPRARQGPGAPWNIVPACTPCNLIKGSALPTAEHLEVCEFCAQAVTRWKAGERGKTRAEARSKIRKSGSPPRPRGPAPETTAQVYPPDLACLSPAMRQYLLNQIKKGRS